MPWPATAVLAYRIPPKIRKSTDVQWGESVCAHHVRVECEDFVLLVIEANDGSRGRLVTHEEHTIIALDTWAWH